MIFLGAILLGIGSISTLWVISDLFFIILGIYLTYKGVRIPKKVILFILFLVTASFFSENPNLHIIITFRLLFLSIFVNYAINNKYKKYIPLLICSLLLVQTLLIPFDLFSHERAKGVMINAYLLGEIGLLMFLMSNNKYSRITASIYLVGSLTRSTIFITLIYSLISKNKKLFMSAALLFLSMLVIIFAKDSTFRFTPSGIKTSIEIRYSTLVADSKNGTRNIVLDSYKNPPQYNKPAFNILGYGLGGYLKATGIQRPHNFYLLSYYELGIISIYLFGLLIYMFYKKKINRNIFISLLLLGLFTEDLLIRPEIQYMTTALFIMSTYPIREGIKKTKKGLPIT